MHQAEVVKQTKVLQDKQAEMMKLIKQMTSSAPSQLPQARQ